MLKNYFINEAARYGRHPYIYTGIILVVVGWTAYDAYQLAKYERMMNTELD